MAQALVEEGVPGAAVALASVDSAIFVGGFGKADPETGREVRPETPFAAPALSPLLVTLTALRVAALLEEGERLDPHAHLPGEGHPRGDGLAWSFSLADDQLLVPAGNGAFRADSAPLPSIALVAGPDGDRLVTPEGTFVKAGAAWVILRLALLLAALLLLAASALFALAWLPRALFGALKGAPDLRLRALPALAAVVLFEWLLLWSRARQPLGELNLRTALLAVLPVVSAALALAGLLEALFALRLARAGPRPLRPRARALLAFCFAASLAAVLLAGLLAAYGLVGVRTWAL